MNESVITESLKRQLLEECVTMANYALTSGISVPGKVLIAIEEVITDRKEEQPKPSGEELSDVELERLNAAHQILSQLVAPSTPRTIHLMARQQVKYPVLCHIGPLPLIRWLLGAAIMFLVLLIGLATTDATNLVDPEGNPTDWSIFNSSGTTLLTRMMFLLSAAGLGACFAALFRANKFIIEGTYDPKYAVSYWIRITLGLIAGLILSEMVPLADPSLQGTAKPILALLGGFSSATLYRILNRLVEAIESVVEGDQRDVVKVQQRAVEALSNQKIAQDQISVLQKQKEEAAKPAGRKKTGTA